MELVETANTRRRCVSISEFLFFTRNRHVQKGQFVIMSLSLWQCEEHLGSFFRFYGRGLRLVFGEINLTGWAYEMVGWKRRPCTVPAHPLSPYGNFGIFSCSSSCDITGHLAILGRVESSGEPGELALLMYSPLAI